MADERRTFQRLNLGRAIDGWFGERAVRIADVSASGAQLIVDAPIEDGIARGCASRGAAARST